MVGEFINEGLYSYIFRQSQQLFITTGGEPVPHELVVIITLYFDHHVI